MVMSNKLWIYRGCKARQSSSFLAVGQLFFLELLVITTSLTVISSGTEALQLTFQQRSHEVGKAISSVFGHSSVSTKIKGNLVAHRGPTPDLSTPVSNPPAELDTRNQCEPLEPDPAVDWAQKLGQHASSIDGHDLEHAIANQGDSSRARCLLSKLMAGKPINIGTVGASVAWGHGASNIGENDFHALIVKWVNATFPNSAHQHHNGGTPGVGPGYMALCMEWHVPVDVDLVFVQYAFTISRRDKVENHRGYECVLRRLLELPHRPTVILVMLHWWSQQEIQFEPGKHRGPEHYRFYNTPTDELAVFGQYYQLPVLQMRNMLYHRVSNVSSSEHGLPFGTVQLGPELGQGADFVPDGIHVSDLGHRMVADMVIGYLQKMGAEALRHPVNSEDQLLAREGLPEPMLIDNWPARQGNCIIGQAMTTHVVRTDGFDLVDEGTPDSPKIGYVARNPGSSLILSLDTSTPPTHSAGLAPAHVPPHVRVMLYYLQSYEHMGSARVECVSGCSCEAVSVDALHTADRDSIMVPLGLAVSQSESCQMKITVEKETKSGEHKFKVTGVVIHPDAVNDAGQDYNVNVVIPWGSTAYREAGKSVHQG